MKTILLFSVFFFSSCIIRAEKVTQDSISNLILLAKQGDAKAQTNLGFCYHYSKGVAQDYKEAVKWYTKAAKQNLPVAQYNLGVCYANGQGVKKNYKEAVKWYRKAAEQGDETAQNSLGKCYENGRGVTKDYEEAVKWYRKAAEQGNANAQKSLGICYEYGLGIAKGFFQAVYWYQKAAEQGNAIAQNNLGVCYTFGRGVTKDYAEAVKWYRKAAEKGLPIAQKNLGICYENGQGVIKNYEEAFKWYRKAAEQGDVNAQNYLGVYYENGRGVTKDYAEAFKWYRKAAEQGDANSQYILGNCYYYGRGVTKDYAEAFKWYRKAAEQGNTSAQNDVGVCYKTGRGVTKDYAEAVKWYRKAAEQGNTSAQTNLGRCYENAEGVFQNYTEAFKWYRKAAEQGDETAQNSLGECYENGRGVTKDYDEAIKWYRKAAEQGAADYQYDLAYKYETKKDYVEAIKWYLKVVDQGFSFADDKLKDLEKKGIYEEIKINGQRLHKIKANDSKYVLISDNGTNILKREWDSLTPIGDIYVKVCDGNCYGIFNINGEELIPISRGYKSIDNYNKSSQTFVFKKSGLTGLCNIYGQESSLSKIPLTLDEIKMKGGYDDVFKINNGTKNYWRVRKNNKFGLADEMGNVIIPLEFNYLTTAGTGYLKYEQNGFWGIMNYSGKIIIDTTRGYTSISDFISLTKRFSYVMYGYRGECDSKGRQLSKIKVVTPPINKTYKSAEANNSSLASNIKQSETNISSKEKDNDKPGLLYRGWYNRNSQGRNLNTGQFTGFPGSDWEEKVEIYKDSIVVQGTPYEYSGTSGKWKMYSLDYGGAFGKYLYFVDENYNMKLHITSPNPYMGGSDTFVYTMTKDGSQNVKYYGNQDGQVLNNNSSINSGSSINNIRSSVKSSSSSSRPICTVCHGDGKCHSCHGSGKRTDNYFGTGTDYSKDCGVCGGKKICIICNGTGHR